MATRAHSRFTDDVYCTPAPSAPQITVRTKDDLNREIFLSDADTQFQPGLIAAEELKSKDLYENYSPQFKDENKRFIFELLNQDEKYAPSSNKSILVTRWKPFIPFLESDVKEPTTVDYKTDGFTYESDNDNQTVEWYLNFANNDIFAYYGGHLLAQDELQVLECVELAALREYFVQAVNTIGSRTVGSDAHTGKPVPTPILVSNTERVINLDTKDVYGNAFAKADQNQLKTAFHKVKPQIVNLIAIEAPSYGDGSYTNDQVQYILATCYTGFKAAQILANKTHAMNKNKADSSEPDSSRSDANHLRTIIHTGWWGCGAYGNNRQMMLIAQTLAARWAQIDKIVFHVQNNEHQKDIDEAKKFLEAIRPESSVEEITKQIMALNLEWEKSNNT